MREECRLRVFENRVLRRIFGPKRDEVTGEWRRLHSKKLNGVVVDNHTPILTHVRHKSNSTHIKTHC